MASKQPVPIKYPPSDALAPLWARVVDTAMVFPGMQESRSYGTPALKVKGKFLARLRSEAEGGLAIRCQFPEREMLLQAAPETFYITDHYRDYEMVLVNLDTVLWEAMPGIIEHGWRMVASQRLQVQWDAARG